MSALADCSMETKLKDIWSMGRRQKKLTGPFLLWPPHSLAAQRLQEQASGRGWLLMVLVTQQNSQGNSSLTPLRIPSSLLSGQGLQGLACDPGYWPRDRHVTQCPPTRSSQN